MMGLETHLGGTSMKCYSLLVTIHLYGLGILFISKFNCYDCSIIPKLTLTKYSQSYLFSFQRSHYSITSPITNQVNMYIYVRYNKYHFNNKCFTTNLQA